jgi:hypothetical protein
VDYRQPLATLKDIKDLQPAHLLTLVEACSPATRSRLRAGRAAAAMAQALGWSDELVAELRQRGKGYSGPPEKAATAAGQQRWLIASL